MHMGVLAVDSEFAKVMLVRLYSEVRQPSG